MSAHAHNRSVLLPQSGPRAGQALWGEAPRRQPIAPLVIMAVILLLVAAPTALGSGGGTSNPITLMREIAQQTYEIAGLMQQSNGSLAKIDTNSSHLSVIQEEMGGIAGASANMASKTEQLNTKLETVGGAVAASATSLGSVSEQLEKTTSGMGSLRKNITAARTATKTVVREFGTIDSAITKMDTGLRTTVGVMAKTAPVTKAFAQNETRMEIAGGSSKKYKVPNIAAQSRVMGVVLPMIATMQQGGQLPARKDSHTASNPIVGTALRLQVPDGTNVIASVKPFDGQYGLPGADYFVNHRIYGF